MTGRTNALIVKNERGMALLITIMVVSLLMALTLQLGRTIRHKYFSSATFRDSQQLHVVSMSGVNIAKALLENDLNDNEFDVLSDVWATLSQDSLEDFFTAGTLNLKVEDLSGKLQVNSLVGVEAEGKQGENDKNANDNREILNQLLLSGNLAIEGEDQAREIIDSLVDWLDEDDRESDFGAESGYYGSLDPPYESRNGPVMVIEELLKVKGITAELLYGTDEKPGLADYLTAFGSDGLININTAPVELIRAMNPQISEELAESMDEYRRDENNYETLENASWYLNVSAWPGDIELQEKLITTQSVNFKIISEAEYQDLRRRLVVVVERDEDEGIRELYRKVD